MKPITNPAGGIFRNLPVLSLLSVFALFTVSCEKGGTPADDSENFVNLSISDVSDGHFTVNFQAGKNTKTIEYAVCYAVNMKADSVAFREGSLDNIRQAVPGEDGKVSVSFDFSDPLDLGPYTVYARAISGSGQTSRFVKEQVCALTTGITLEYQSRSKITVKISCPTGENAYTHSGYIRNSSVIEIYGSIDELLNGINQENEGFIASGIRSFDIVSKNNTESGMVDGTVYNVTDSQPFEDSGYIYWGVIDKTNVPKSYAFQVTLPEKIPSVPLPEPVTIGEFTPIINGTDSLTRSHIILGNNTDVAYFANLRNSFYEGWMENYTEEEIVQILIWNANNYYTLFGNEYINYTGYYDEDSFIVLAVPFNFNFERGPLTATRIPSVRELLEKD